MHNIIAEINKSLHNNVKGTRVDAPCSYFDLIHSVFLTLESLLLFMRDCYSGENAMTTKIHQLLIVKVIYKILCVFSIRWIWEKQLMYSVSPEIHYAFLVNL